jgi:hypothetical protein
LDSLKMVTAETAKGEIFIAEARESLGRFV